MHIKLIEELTDIIDENYLVIFNYYTIFIMVKGELPYLDKQIR